MTAANDDEINRGTEAMMSPEDPRRPSVVPSERATESRADDGGNEVQAEETAAPPNFNGKTSVSADDHDSTMTASGISSSPVRLTAPVVPGTWQTVRALQDFSLPEPQNGDNISRERGRALASEAPRGESVANMTGLESTSPGSSGSGEMLAMMTDDGNVAVPIWEPRPSMIGRDVLPQAVTTAGIPPEPTRPTSVPTVRRQRDGPEYPSYPNQAFAALQSQHYPPPYQPHPLRTRSSHPSQRSFYSTRSSQGRDGSTVPSGAKTADNTPSQSPSLFTPTFSRNRDSVDDYEDSHYSAPLLHPTHLQAPKETHKLLKDFDPVSGRKIINNYEFVGKLGSGTHGTVKLGRNTETSELVAIKIVRRFSKKVRLGKPPGEPEDLTKREVAILKKARHPHVVSLLEVIDDNEFGKVYLVLEYVELGEITWRKMTDQDVATFEMSRIRRERSGRVDEGAEVAEMERFNGTVMSRREAKARSGDKHERHAQHRLRVRTSSARRSAVAPNPFWSLEYANESEDELATETGPSLSLAFRESDRSSAEHHSSHENREFSPESSTPAQSNTPKPSRPSPGEPESSGALTDAQHSSRPASPVSSDGTFRPSRLSDRPFPAKGPQSTFEPDFAGQFRRTPEEEEFMYVPCLTISQARDVFRDTILGLEYLHYQGIIHRDIKPANLLWTADRRVKISDFGVSYLGRPIRENEHKEEIAEADGEDRDEALELAKTVGTPAFYAPELCDPRLFDFAKHPDRPQVTGQIDVWALGVTLYGMIFGRLPFFDVNEFAMYEKIAMQEVFIPQLRLKAVQDGAHAWANGNKRPDDVLEYEEVDEELRDLLQRLLEKHPSKRICLREVKHHPWVLRGISDTTTWVQETDPSLQSQGRRIEVSTQEVQEAVVGLRIVDYIKSGIHRLNSIVRGRDGRKRGHSHTKTSASSTSMSSSASKAVPGSHDGRSPSLKGDEQIYSALRASREGSEHPLSQSVAASPETKPSETFDDGDASTGVRDDAAENPFSGRPSFLERTLSNAESTRTIRPPLPPLVPEIASASAEPFSPMTTVVDTSSSSSLSGIFGGAGRRFVNSMRSRERGRGRGSLSRSSRSSSVETGLTGDEDPHGSPSVALSSAVAAGHVDLPPALRDDISSTDTPPADLVLSTALPRTAGDSSSSVPSADQEADDYTRPREDGSGMLNRRRTVSSAVETISPSASGRSSIAMDHEHLFFSSDDHPQFGVSSSSDHIASGMSESTSHPSFPSVVSGASSLSAHTDDNFSSLMKELSTPPPVASGDSFGRDHPPHRVAKSKLKKSRAPADDDEAGYNGEGESDSDSDDEGIEIGGSR